MQKNTPKDSAKIPKICTIKIIAGRFKGKVLNATILPHTRPTKAIVRESVFNTIAPFLRGKIFVECFAGYGSMGFEALSRGALRVIFLEKDAQSFGILQKNIALFDKTFEDSRGDSHNLRDKIKAQNVDCFAVLGEIMRKYTNAIFYFDPPFGENGEFYKKIFMLLDSIVSPKDLCESNIDSGDSHTNPPNLANQMLIFEHNSAFQMPDLIANLPRQKYKKFGKTSISYYFMA
ncbi:16S rRNA (guanine(966)-N(2))-methyltransferase RsmD [Helicobacter sp. 23-1044]